ncbi:Peroxisomal membrane protein LPX1 [Termitomyces sp. J132]|nr:Peroxisomal membrane protein LPX1 [Termitomyces sp. J132]
MTLHIDSFIFRVDATDLQSTAKRYTSRFGSKDGLTLVFAHCVGSHKEQWEPTIEQIFRLQQSKNRRDRIREAWAFDWQSHGDAAVINAGVLNSRNEAVSPVEWALALESFVNLHLKGHRVVAFGHSAGTAAMSVLSCPVMLASSSKSKYFLVLFLVEPTILSQELFDAHAKEREDSANLTMKATLARRDSWPNKGAAAAYLRGRLPWTTWDPRVFNIYVNHGLQALSTSDGEAVGLKTDKRQEGMTYPQFAPYIESVTLFRERCMIIPFHIIFGEKIDFMPRYIQEGLSDTSQGFKPASVTRVSSAGHLVSSYSIV